ncbi:flavin reductase family protein [Sphingomonas sp. MMS24-JH45]
MTEWHFYEPAGPPPAARSVERDRRAAADRVDQHRLGRRRAQPRAVQLLQLVRLSPADHRLLLDRREGFSLANVQATGEFVWNLVTRPQAEAMNATSAGVGAAADEFALSAGLDALPARSSPDRVAGSPVQFECAVTQIVQLRDRHGGDMPNWLVLGEAVGIHIDAALLEDGIYQTARAEPISRGGGPADYFATRPDALFRMRRPDRREFRPG